MVVSVSHIFYGNEIWPQEFDSLAPLLHMKNKAIIGFISAILLLCFSTQNSYAEGINFYIPWTSDGNEFAIQGTASQDGLGIGAFTFTDTGTITAISPRNRIKRYGDPDDTVEFALWKGGANPTAGTKVASCYLNKNIDALVAETWDEIIRGCNLTTSYTITSTADTYWYVISRTGSASTTAYWAFDDNPNGFQSANTCTRSAGTWSCTGSARRFPVGFEHATYLQEWSSIATSTIDYLRFLTSTSTPDIDCSSYSAGLFSSSTLQALSCYTRETFFWAMEKLFYPSQASIDIVNEAITSFENVFPFNVFFTIVSTLETQADLVTASTTAITIPYPPFAGGGSLTLFDDTTVQSAIGETAYDEIRNVEEHFIWALFGIAVLSTIKKGKLS